MTVDPVDDAASNKNPAEMAFPVTRTSGKEPTLMSNWVALAIRQSIVGAATVVGLIGLARLLSPQDFATFGYATAAILIAASIGDLGLGAALVREGVTDERIRASFGLQLGAWIPVCVLGAAAAAATGLYGLSWEVQALLAACFFLYALQTLPTALLERSRLFGTIAGIESSQRVVFVLAAFVLALVSSDRFAVALAACLAGSAGYLAALIAVRWRWIPRLAGAHTVFSGFSSSWWQGRLAGQLNYAVYPLLGGLLFTSEQVGWIVWALAISSIPAVLATLAARALLPNLAAVAESARVDVFRRLFRPLLLVSVPAIAALFASAEPLTLHLFGSNWAEAVPLLRLESITSLLGVALTPLVPLLYVVYEPSRIRTVLVLWAAGVWAGTLLLADFASYLAPSLAQIAAAVVALVVCDRLLARAGGYSIVRDLWAIFAVGVLVAACGWWSAPSLATDGISTLLFALGVMMIAFAAILAVSRDMRVRVWRRLIERPSTP